MGHGIIYHSYSHSYSIWHGKAMQPTREQAITSISGCVVLGMGRVWCEGP